MVLSLPNLKAPEKHVCKGCILAKMQQASFPKDSSMRADHKTDHKSQLVHSDVCGPTRTPLFGNYLCFVTFIDDYLRHGWVYPLKSKFDVFMCFKHFISMVENVLGCKVGTLYFDQGRIYVKRI